MDSASPAGMSPLVTGRLMPKCSQPALAYVQVNRNTFVEIQSGLTAGAVKS